MPFSPSIVVAATASAKAMIGHGLPAFSDAIRTDLLARANQID